VELFPRRVTDNADAKFLYDHTTYDDPCDTKLYEAAKRIFQEELDFIEASTGV
jgi:hypothetical protein